MLMTLPPLNGIIALEAVIRLDSVRRAADELGISQPAVSQRLRSLEQHFGRRLIERTPSGFRVEPDVETLALRLRVSIEGILSASTDFRETSRNLENRLTIALLSTFAQRWLIPRLLGFQQKHPQIDVHLMTTSLPSDLERSDADISIRSGSGHWPGQTSEFLVGNQIFPVASSTYIERFSLREPSDLCRVMCIKVDASPRDLDWSHWLGSAGAEEVSPQSWQTYTNSTHAMEAATAGLGVAMAHSPFVSDSVASGRLVKPFQHECGDRDGDYYLVHQAAKDIPRRVRLFRDWLLNQFNSDP